MDSPTRILVVDDDEVADSLERSHSGFDVETASCYTDCLDRIVSVDYDCVVSGYGVPGGDGIKLLESVRNRFPNLPFILYTDSGSEEIASKAISADVTDYLTKDRHADGDPGHEALARRILGAVEDYHAEKEDGVGEHDALSRRIDIDVETVSQSLKEPIVAVDATGQIAFANQRLLNVTQLSSDDTLGASYYVMFRRFVDEGFDRLTQAVEEVSDGDSDERRVEVLTRHPDSAPVPPKLPAEARVVPMEEDGSRIGSVVVWRDISERKQIESELRRRERQFRAMFERHSAPMLLIEPDTGSIQEANQAAVEFYGYSDDELTSMGIQEINTLSPEQVEEERKKAERQDRNHFVFKHKLSDGEIRTVEVHSSPIEFEGDELLFSIIHDITERRRQEKVRKRFERAIEETGHAVYITDSDGVIEYVNPAFERITGYTAEEAIGKTPRILKSGRMDDDYYEELWKTVKSGKIWSEEIYDQRKSGDIYIAHQTIAPITQDGEITGYVAIQNDISERKEYEHEIEKKNRQLSVMDRVLRHNLRNDLNVVKGHAELIRDSVGRGEDRNSVDIRSHSETIIDETQQLLKTADKQREITNLLADPSSVGEVDIAAMIESKAEKFREKYPDADISVSVAESRPTVGAIPEIGTALEELIDNSLSHSDRSTPKVDVELTLDEEEAVVEVRDNGSGIPEMERKVLTDNESIEPLYHGSGLGLWLVKEIIDQSGGSLDFDERESRGSIVRLRLGLLTDV
ncbi:PAS domain S-box protein [Halorutilales archaeon Cl-col2-1]